MVTQGKCEWCLLSLSRARLIFFAISSKWCSLLPPASANCKYSDGQPLSQLFYHLLGANSTEVHLAPQWLYLKAAWVSPASHLSPSIKSSVWLSYFVLILGLLFTCPPQMHTLFIWLEKKCVYKYIYENENLLFPSGDRKQMKAVWYHLPGNTWDIGHSVIFSKLFPSLDFNSYVCQIRMWC